MTQTPDTSAEAVRSFKYQCECNLSYVEDSDKTVVEIGQQHLIDQFEALAAENARLRAELAEAQELDMQWRDLALQFDAHRMQALGLLKSVAASDEANAGRINEFLSQPPLSGEKVLEQRLADLSRPAPVTVSLSEAEDEISEIIRTEAQADFTYHVHNSPEVAGRIVEVLRENYVTPTTTAQAAHPDDEAVDQFAAMMKAKLARARDKGKAGWSNPEACTIGYLVHEFHDHVGKRNSGNWVDLANLAMMVHLRTLANQERTDD